jgi:hypothetical protein
VSFDEYLKLWSAILLDMRVLFAIACLFVLGALLRFIAFGRRNPGAFKRPILKLIEKVTAQENPDAISTASSRSAAKKKQDESEEIGLTEEEYPTEEEEDELPEPRRRK